MKRTTVQHVIKVINSCVTRDQLANAMNYASLSGFLSQQEVIEALRVKTFASYTTI